MSTTAMESKTAIDRLQASITQLGDEAAERRILMFGRLLGAIILATTTLGTLIGWPA